MLIIYIIAERERERKERPTLVSTCFNLLLQKDVLRTSQFHVQANSAIVFMVHFRRYYKNEILVRIISDLINCDQISHEQKYHQHECTLNVYLSRDLGPSGQLFR